MRYLFLDIDGVLNTYEYIWSPESKTAPVASYLEFHAQKIETDKVQILNRILEEIGAVVVVSAALRVGHSKEELQDILNLAGFTGKIVGKTPSLWCRRRGQEILHWMGTHGVEPDEAVILEDEVVDQDLTCDMLVKVNMKTGLQESHVQEVVDLFK